MIVHIVRKTDWERTLTSGEYRHASLVSQGFIHCSKPDQVVNVANTNFKGQSDLILLLIDEQRVKSEIKYEDGGSGELYPHIYGPLNIDAVIHTMDFPCDIDGTFSTTKL